MTQNFPNSARTKSTKRDQRLITFAILCLAFFFLASHIGIMIPQFTGLPQPIFFAISGAALIPLWWKKQSTKKSRFRHHPKMAILQTSAFCVFVLAGCSVLMAVSADSSIATLTSAGGKTAGLLSVYLTLMYCSCAYTTNQISKALLIYGFFELAMLFFTNHEWNANTVAVRGSTAGLVGFYLLKSWPKQVAALLVGMAVAIIFRSRTVTVGMILSVLLMWIVNRAPKNKELIFIGFLSSALLLFAFSGQIREVGFTIANNSLGSDNPISQFFLEDKTVVSIQSNFLDRSQIWEVSFETIRRNPWLGIGIGNESSMFGTRSHNAYLSLAVEGGLASALLWIIFYAAVGHFLVFQTRQYSDPDVNRLIKLATCLLVYMLISGMVETAGLASISSPNNLICLFITLWAMTSGVQRKSAGVIQYQVPPPEGRHLY